MIVGHSFGGLIVYSALSEYFVEQAARSAEIAALNGSPLSPQLTTRSQDGQIQDRRQIQGFGDLVVVINPAVEAMQYDPIWQLMVKAGARTTEQQQYTPWQSPVLVEVTSVGGSAFSGDWATGLAFPAGRSVSTIFEALFASFKGGEHAEAIEALGQYAPFWTHYLTYEPNQVVTTPTLTAQCERLQKFNAEWRPHGYLLKGWTIRLGNGTRLSQGRTDPKDPNKVSDTFDPNSPFWVVRADPSVIIDHNDISNDKFVGFITELYNDIVFNAEPDRCPQQR